MRKQLIDPWNKKGQRFIKKRLEGGSEGYLAHV